MVKKSSSGSGMNIPDHVSERLGTIFGLKIKNVDPGSQIFLTRDPGSKIPIKDQ
jgi:hypothetical protein